jgi:hypothetical protein
MALWPTFTGGAVTGSASPSASLPVTVTSGGSAHTKGAWAELITLTDRGFDTLTLSFVSTDGLSATDRSQLLDVGFGGSGSEQVVIADIVRGHAPGGSNLRLPIRIPAGTRISTRIQTAGASVATTVAAHLSGGQGWGGGGSGRRATTYGANAATSGGVALTLPGTNNVKGAWTEIVASTTAPLRWILPRLAGPVADTTMNNANYMVDVGIGGSGSEQVVIADIPFRMTSGEAVVPVDPTFAVDVPSGTRLSMRMACNSVGSAEAIVASIVGID